MPPSVAAACLHRTKKRETDAYVRRSRDPRRFPIRLRRVKNPWRGLRRAQARTTAARCRASYPTEQHQHHDDDDDQPERARWPIAPASAMRPRRKCADEQQNQYHDNDGTEHCTPPGRVRNNGFRRRNSCAATPTRARTGRRMPALNS